MHSDLISTRVERLSMRASRDFFVAVLFGDWVFVVFARVDSVSSVAVSESPDVIFQ